MKSGCRYTLRETISEIIFERFWSTGLKTFQNFCWEGYGSFEGKRLGVLLVTL